MNFFPYLFKNEREKSNVPQTSFLRLESRLESNKANLSTTPKSSYILLSKENIISFFFLNFQLVEIIECNASLNNQCP
jgi:hypothetical protein